MGLIKKIFQKELEELKVDDIRTFFEVEQEETSILEFKSGKVSIESIYKEVAAFLNTEGGLIIIGAPQEKTIKSKKMEKNICQGELTYSEFRNKDWLYQKIASNITPIPNGIEIFQNLSPDGNIYILDIPQSQNPPHQSSSDGRYYIRFGTEAKPSPHGLVEALFNRRKQPVFKSTLSIETSNSFKDLAIIKTANISTMPAEKVTYSILVAFAAGVQSPGLDFTESEEHNVLVFSAIGEVKVLLGRTQTVNLQLNIAPDPEQDKYIVIFHVWSRATDVTVEYWLYQRETNKIVEIDKSILEELNLT